MSTISSKLRWKRYKMFVRHRNNITLLPKYLRLIIVADFIIIFQLAFLPFAYTIDNYRWGLFNGTIAENEMNYRWWELR